MNILFITSNRLGDAVLSAGILDRLVRLHPGAAATVVCGRLPASLFEGVPGLAEIVVLEKKKYNAHWLGLWKRVAGRRWGIAVDLRNSVVSRLIRADRCFRLHPRTAPGLHKVEQCAAALGLPPAEAPPPVLWFTAAQKEKAWALVPDGGPVLGIGPAANWIGKTWPADRFAALAVRLTAEGGVLPDARVAVFAAPGEEKAARAVLEGVPAPRRIDVIAKADPGTAAAALARCSLYVGNDSGLMHCAAAAGVPTVGLFGPSRPDLYRPWGARAAFIQAPGGFAALTGDSGGGPAAQDRSLMTGLSLEAAADGVEKFWRSLPPS